MCLKLRNNIIITLNYHEQVYRQMTSHAITIKICNMKHFHPLYISVTINFMSLKSNATFLLWNIFPSLWILLAFYAPGKHGDSTVQISTTHKWYERNSNTVCNDPCPQQCDLFTNHTLLALNRTFSPSHWERNTKTKQPIRFQGLFKVTNQIATKWDTKKAKVWQSSCLNCFSSDLNFL